MTVLKRIDSPFGHRFELHHNSERVSSLILFDYTLTFNSSELKMGGIAGVQTHREHRNKGYASELMEATIAWMKEEEYPCSFLYGIPNFYWRYGYATLLTHASTKVLVRDLESSKIQTDFAIRPYKESDLDAVRDLFNENNSGRMCSIVRGPSWRGIPRGSDWPIEPICLVAESASGEFSGYVVYDAKRPEVVVSEVETSHPAAQYAILDALAQVAIEQREKEIEYVGPTSHPFAIFLRRFGAKHMDLVERHGFGMGRLIHLEAFFSQIVTELSRRSWMLTGQARYHLHFQTDIGECGLDVIKGSVQVTNGQPISPETTRIQVICSQLELTRLVFGVVDHGTFSVSPETTVSGPGAEVLPILFPTQLSTIPPTSWF